MHISKVELSIIKEIPEGTMQDGLPVAPHPEIVSFVVTTDEESHVEGKTTTVPADPSNRHYHEIAEWYKAQKKKPFKYDF